MTIESIKSKLNIQGLKHLIPSIKKKSWMVTILFSLSAFAGSVYVWRDCVFNNQPRPVVVTAFNQNKEDFEKMSKKVSGAIEKLQLQKQELENSKNFDGQRELFRQPEPPALKGTGDKDSGEHDKTTSAEDSSSEPGEDNNDQPKNQDYPEDPATLIQ